MRNENTPGTFVGERKGKAGPERGRDQEERGPEREGQMGRAPTTQKELMQKSISS